MVFGCQAAVFLIFVVVSLEGRKGSGLGDCLMPHSWSGNPGSENRRWPGSWLAAACGPSIRTMTRDSRTGRMPLAIRPAGRSARIRSGSRRIAGCGTAAGWNRSWPGTNRRQAGFFPPSLRPGSGLSGTPCHPCRTGPRSAHSGSADPQPQSWPYWRSRGYG
jgi:hypothetical protein